MKENKYQLEGKRFLEKQFESYNGKAIEIYTEEFSQEYDSILQESSPLIGGKIGDSDYNTLKSQFGIIGLREKINEFNQSQLEDFLKKHKRKELISDVLNLLFEDFKIKYSKAENEAELFQLIFSTNSELKPHLRREIYLKGMKEPFSYNVIFYETPGNYLGKNSFYSIRERRIPVFMHQYKKTERPDFLHYINGIPLVLVEYKTEDSGILQSIKDFEFKESYKKAPFKVALNDGRDVIFFSDIKFLKFSQGKDNSFHWVHYLPNKKHVGQREFTNIEYLYDELLCQPEHLYNYCMYGCTVVDSNSHYYLINSRIQQYYAIKDCKKTLDDVSTGLLKAPYNFEFAHAQRSGKTITMKLISYMIEKSYKGIFNTIFMYSPDLQIKDVINAELAKSGNPRIIVKMVQTRQEYQDIIDNLYRMEQENKEHTSLFIYIVNMQKISDKDLQSVSTRKVINSSKILNIIDEAHHGQTKETALIRDTIFPKASNYLFTATGKTDMYLYYFPDNNRKGFSNKFTISNAKQCKITVPVHFLKAEKHFQLSQKLAQFSEEIEKRLKLQYENEASILGMSVDNTETEKFLDFGNYKVSSEIKKLLQKETIFEKLQCIVEFMNSVRVGLPFAPKGIVYVNSVEDAKKYIEFIQTHNANNEYLGYRFGVDFSSIKDVCEQYNPGIKEPALISANFQKERSVKNNDNKQIIDILFAVDKYQKGFDLPPLLVTYLDTNISEPARMNQIFTRSATKYPGKITGYCMDLTFENINQETFQQSLLLYDNAEDIGDSFLDDALLDSLKSILADQFKSLMIDLNLNAQNFTASMILQQVLNESDLQLRQKRQYSFFTTSKKIMANMNKMGSPLFYKPFHFELKSLYEAFNEFKKIYADKLHPEHHKILIDTDSSFKDGQYLTTEEIRSIINEVLFFLKENNIKDIISFSFTNKQTEISADENSKKDVLKKFSQELKKNNIEKDLELYKEYLSKNHKELFDVITDMLSKISDDRNLIYQEFVQEKLTEIENKLDSIKNEIAQKIEKDFNNNSFLFWSNEVATQILKANGIIQPEFVSFVSEEVYKSMHIVLGQIEPDLSNFNKVQIAIDMFNDKTKAETFSFYLVSYKGIHGISENFIKQLQSAPKLNNELIMTRKDLFNQYLNQTLRQYYQNLKK